MSKPTALSRWARGLVFALVCGTAALPTAAQQGRIEIAKRGWLGFRYDPIFSPNARAGLEIRAVSSDSPAERAGIQPGDTLLEVNGITATPQLVMSLGSALAPGDTVRLRLRRDGQDRALTLEAAERSVQYMRLGDRTGVIALSPDTLRRRLRILTDSLRIYADTFRMPNVYFHWQDEGERYRAYWSPDSMRTLWGPDSMRALWDSLSGSDFEPFETIMLPGVRMLGLRAVAGAELADLTPGLARAFNARNGVLVLRVLDDTPARRAGLAEADVIVRANGTGVGSVAELRRIIARAHSASDPARLEVLRNGKRVMVVLRRR